jgi:hypothetical protein
MSIIKPKTLFLIDGFGALASAFLLSVVVARFESIFGMPQKISCLLALVAGLYAIYSFTNYFFIKENREHYLRIIALANLIYCCITAGFVFYYYQLLTSIGLIYFLTEIVLIVNLAVLAFKSST